ncbi:MAG: hypothetical protein AB1Z65_13525 [Candidatus Sulfomarinibacteraceae bacterium]
MDEIVGKQYFDVFWQGIGDLRDGGFAGHQGAEILDKAVLGRVGAATLSDRDGKGKNGKLDRHSVFHSMILLRGFVVVGFRVACVARDPNRSGGR